YFYSFRPHRNLHLSLSRQCHMCIRYRYIYIYIKDVLKIYKDFLSQKNKTIFVVSHHIPEEIKHLFDEIIEL
ncbi:hypothetical protein, partial [Mesomycoplasma hyorhinis]|uniref:hypothetical protein n=1 Tax=Mesomycoplasma hyorhinis TaxID=2100 RepID=UPI001C0530CC